MSSYLQTRSDLAFIRDWRRDVMELWVWEQKAEEALEAPFFATDEDRREAVAKNLDGVPEYVEVRRRVARGVRRAMNLAHRLDVPVTWKQLPPPAIGGPVVSVNLFYAILHDNSFKGVNRRDISDLINQTEGACEEDLTRRFRRLMNPFWWVIELVAFIIRIPFVVVETAGINVAKFEDHFLAKVFKVLEIIAIVSFLLWLGFSRADILEVIGK